MGWISKDQQDRDHKGKRDRCGACGHPFTAGDPQVLTKKDATHAGGSRVHRSHTTDPSSGFHGLAQ